MSTTQSEMALDSLVLETWKRARSPEEISRFLARRAAAIEAMTEDDDVELD